MSERLTWNYRALRGRRAGKNPVRSPMMLDRRTANPNIPDFTTHRQIETQLHTKLEAARTEYESALERYQRAVKYCDERRLKNVQDGNGDSQPTVEQLVSQAVKPQRHAFEEYGRALDRVNRFILCRDLPERSDSTGSNCSIVRSYT
jgi:hypothetical protein